MGSMILFERWCGGWVIGERWDGGYGGGRVSDLISMERKQASSHCVRIQKSTYATTTNYEHGKQESIEKKKRKEKDQFIKQSPSVAQNTHTHSHTSNKWMKKEK